MGLPIISLPKEIFVVHVQDFPRVPEIRLGAQSDRICGHFLQSSSRLVFEQTLEHSALNCGFGGPSLSSFNYLLMVSLPPV